MNCFSSGNSLFSELLKKLSKSQKFTKARVDYKSKSDLNLLQIVKIQCSEFTKSKVNCIKYITV